MNTQLSGCSYSLLPGPLKVVIPTKSVSSYLGDTALLECKVSGDPSPAVRWQKNREDLPVTFDPNSHLAMLPSGSLQVSRVQPPDSAMYRCLADNPGSSRTGSDAELRVLPGTVGTLTFAMLWEYSSKGGGGILIYHVRRHSFPPLCFSLQTTALTLFYKLNMLLKCSFAPSAGVY